MNLVNQIEHNRDGLVVYAELAAQIGNQPGARQIDVGKFTA